MKTGWESHKFADIFDLQMGKTPSRENSSYWNGDNIWVSIADMNDKKYISESKECITDNAIEESGIKIVPKNTVIMSFKLSIGKTSITTCPLFTNEAIMSFIEKDKGVLIPEYIYYYLKGYKWEGANKAVMGMTLNKKIISEQVFSYPPLFEQERIVSELDLISGVIDKKKQQLNELDSLAQSIFYEMFGNPVENEKGWDVKKLGEVSHIINGFAFPSSEFSESNPIKAIKITNVGVNEFVDDDSSLPNQYDCKEDYKVHTGDIVIALTRTIISSGVKRALVPKEYNNALVNQRVAAIITDTKIVDKKYVYSFLGTGFVKDYVLTHATALMQPNLSIKDLRELPLIYPPLSLQQEFASMIESIEKQKELIKQSLKETETLFNSRMDYYFN